MIIAMEAAPRIVSPNGTIGTQALFLAVDQADSRARGRTYIAVISTAALEHGVKGDIPSSARLLFSSMKRLRHVAKPINQNVSLRLRRYCITGPTPWLFKACTRRQKIATVSYAHDASNDNDRREGGVKGALTVVYGHEDAQERAASEDTPQCPCYHLLRSGLERLTPEDEHRDEVQSRVYREHEALLSAEQIFGVAVTGEMNARRPRRSVGSWFLHTHRPTGGRPR